VQHDDRVLLSGRRRRALLLTGTLALAAAVTAGISGWMLEADPTEPVPPRADAYSVLSTVASGDGTTWAFGGWYPNPGHPNFRSQAYLLGSEGWTEVAVPNIGRLTASTVIASDDAWAAGNSRYGDATAVHWDGQQWTEVAFAQPPAQRRMFVDELASFGPHDVWAVGDLWSDDPPTEGRGAVQHWDGEVWADVAVPDVPGTWSLSDISGTAPNDLWAVGQVEGSPGLGHCVAVHWDGQRWTQVPVPQIDASPTQDVRLTSVAALATDDVWAAGVRYSYDDSTSEPIMLHFDGDEWTRTQLPVQTGDLTDLVRVGAQVWALSSVVLRYDGSGWQEVPGPAAGTPVAGTVLDDGRLLTVGTAGPGNQKHPFTSVYSG
jgi:hypothetical protein